jgi:hypothetical protein
MTGHLDALIPLERTSSKIILDPDASDESDLSAVPGRSGDGSLIKCPDALHCTLRACANTYG